VEVGGEEANNELDDRLGTTPPAAGRALMGSICGRVIEE
jgi:hypothetical protein